MNLFRKRVTQEQLAEAKHHSLESHAAYKAAEKKVYGEPYSTDNIANEIVARDIEHFTKRQIYYALDLEYEKLWQRYKKENGL